VSKSSATVVWLLYLFTVSEQASSTSGKSKDCDRIPICFQELGGSNHDLNFVHALATFLVSLVGASILMADGL